MSQIRNVDTTPEIPARSFLHKKVDLFSVLDQDKTLCAICDSLGCEYNVPAWPDQFGLAVKRWLEDNNIAPIRTLSLFSGAGGLDIGFSDVGFEIVDSVEIEQKFCETLELNTGEGKRFCNSKVNCVDIREFSGKEIGPIEFIIGGPPCQGFSVIGKMNPDDDRSQLIWSFLKAVETVFPRSFVMENVKALATITKWKDVREAFIKKAKKLGYGCFPFIINAAEYGTPQKRERVFFCGNKELF